jgi:hypothetical protein
MTNPNQNNQGSVNEALLDFADKRQLDHLVEGMTSRERAMSDAGRVVLEAEKIVDQAEQDKWDNFAQGGPIDSAPKETAGK